MVSSTIERRALDRRTKGCSPWCEIATVPGAPGDRRDFAGEAVTVGLSKAKATVRDLLGDLLYLVGVTAPEKRLSGQLSVVTFHRVLSRTQREAYPLPGLSVTPEELDEHLQFLCEHFECTSLAEALRRWPQVRQGQRPLLAITFDDGQLDNFDNALPVLEKHGALASFYVPSQVLSNDAALWHDELARSFDILRTSGAERALGFLSSEGLHPSQEGPGELSAEWAVNHTKSWKPERRSQFLRDAASLARELNLPSNERPGWDRFMSVQQMRELVAKGHEIGAHSHSHALLPQLSDDELRHEIIDSKKLLEEALGSSVETFCYPNGDNDPRVRKVVRDAGYRAAVTTAWGSNPQGIDLFSLRRCDMHASHSKSAGGNFSAARLAFRISGLHPGLRFEPAEMTAPESRI